LSVRITENEADGREEIALPGAIATNNDVQFWREGVDDSLVLVAALG
jgi:hypothetical protein